MEEFISKFKTTLKGQKSPRNGTLPRKKASASSETSDSFNTSLKSIQGIEELPQDIGLSSLRLRKCIGKGAFGTVFLCSSQDSQYYAVKVIKKSVVLRKKMLRKTNAERAIMEKVNHPFIMTLHKAYQTNSKLYLLMDFVQGGELFYHLARYGPFKEDRARLYLAQAATAILHLHENNIVYRDMKPENILLDSAGNIKLTDFGLSKILKIEDAYKTKTLCGTAAYQAPEMILRQSYSTEVDCWALGVLLYELTNAATPFRGSNSLEIRQKVLRDTPNFRKNNQSDLTANFMKALMTKDRSRRLCGEAILRHPYFVNFYNMERIEQIEPKYKPSSKSVTKYVHKEFLSLPVEDVEAQETDFPHKHFKGFQTIAEANFAL